MDDEYVVVCKDQGAWCLATRRRFSVYEARMYGETIHPSRTARVINLTQLLTCLPPAINLVQERIIAILGEDETGA